MRLTLRIITDAKSEKAARAVIGRVRERVGAEFQAPLPYFKGGFEARADIAVPPVSSTFSWPEAVLDALRLANALGNGLYISGDLDCDVSIGLKHFSVSGLIFIEIQLNRVVEAG